MDSEIPKMHDFERRVFAINNENAFETIALEIYRFQFDNNPVYAKYCKILGKNPDVVTNLREIPFLPISLYKTHKIVTTDFEPELIFESSGTTGLSTSFHYVKKREIYERSFKECFKLFYGNINQYCILGLLPSYLEKGGSSLVYMVDCLIKESNHSKSGFYLYNLDKLNEVLIQLKNENQKVILFGVTYALLEFAQQYPSFYESLIIIETGGMKGKGKELTREELNTELCRSFGVYDIHSEYGMTELLSQGYSINGIYKGPPWMKILIRDETDPLSIKQGQEPLSGAINVVDLANIYSCSFIATEDIGRLYTNGDFEVLGRMDNTDIRGCSLLAL
jgi:hypothetical protein